MTEDLSDLETRRHMLVLRCARLRAELGDAYGEFETRLGTVDRIIATARGFASPSLLITLGGLALPFLRRVHPFKWVTRGVLMVSLVRRIFGAVHALRASRPFRR